jgi:hypothetical protein
VRENLHSFFMKAIAIRLFCLIVAPKKSLVKHLVK